MRCTSPVSAQGSFNVEVLNANGESVYMRAGELISKESNLSFIGVDAPAPAPPFSLSLIDFNETGDIIGSWGLTSTDNIAGWQSNITRIALAGGQRLLYPKGRPYDLIQQLGITGILSFDPVSNTTWGRQCSEKLGSYTAMAVNDNSQILVSRHLPNPGMEIFEQLGYSLLDAQTGVEIWGGQYGPLSNVPPNGQLQTFDIVPGGDGQSFVATVYLNYLGENTHKRYFLLDIQADGQINKSIFIDEPDLYFIWKAVADSNGNIYLVGNVWSETSDQELDGVLIKFDQDLNLQWSKRLNVSQYVSLFMEVATTPDGNILVIQTASSYYDLPVVTSKFSPDGQLLWTKGYGFYLPVMALGSDESIFMASRKKYLSDGAFEYGTVITKTTPEGEIEGCPQFDACLNVTDYFIETTPAEWERHSALPLPEMDVTVIDLDLRSAPHCSTPPPPTPFFVIPDTLCQFQCAQARELNNAFANYSEWRLTGPQTDTIVADTAFHWCFDLPGNYLLYQEVWLLGCAEYYEQEIFVLPDNLAPPLGEDLFLCPDDDHLLVPQSSRPLQDFLWQDGTTNSTYEIVESGLHTLNASDGYCEVTDSVWLDLWATAYPDTALFLPDNQQLCANDFPFELAPISAYADVFFLEQNVDFASSFQIAAPGQYLISANIGECIITEEIVFEQVDCAHLVYFPNAFSPNFDGINDVVAPLGIDFEGIQMQVFDRWGSLVHEQKQAPFQWTGTNAPAGIYVVLFEYFNLVNQKQEILTQDVLLVR